MKGFTRTEEPAFLRENADRWNEQWFQLKSKSPGATFQWYKHEGSPVNQLLQPFLKEQTQSHCSYCDGYPPLKGDNTVDHFRPKGVSEFARLAYAWSNLYIACNACQRSKMETFSEDLLAPDADDFSYERYFIYKYDTHEIQPNPAASLDDQRKAEETIRILDLNYKELTKIRQHTLERWEGQLENERNLEDFPYRFILW